MTGFSKKKNENGSYTDGKRLEKIDYNDNCTIGYVHKKFENYSNSKSYDSNGLISVDITTYPDHTYELSYYTSNNPKIPGVDRIGHLQHEYNYYKYGRKYVFNYSGGSEFELVSASPL